MLCGRSTARNRGWTGLKDVRANPPERDDVTQSFFFAETLKYFYLIFADGDAVHLDEWVFNTEAPGCACAPGKPQSCKSAAEIDHVVTIC